MTSQLDEVRKLVIAAADAELLPRFGAGGARPKGDGSLVTEADLAMQARLVSELTRRWPDTTVVGEEMDEAEQQRRITQGGRMWCLDPLDGTGNFAGGVPFFCTAVALFDDVGVELSVVYDPIRRECFSAVRSGGAAVGGTRLAARSIATPMDRATAIVDLKRLPRELAGRLARDPPYRSQRCFGASALEWCWLAAGRGDLYLHGAQQIWDHAAGSLILTEAGGRSLTLAGETLGHRPRDARATSSVAAAADDELFVRWAAWLGVRVPSTYMAGRHER